MISSFNFNSSSEIVFACGAVNRLGETARLFGKRHMIVSDPFCVKSGLTGRLEKNLKDAGLDVVIYDGVVPNPEMEMIDRGAELARSFKAECIIGLGGGSSIDSAKGIAVAAVHKGGIWDYAIGKETITSATLPIIAVTTSSGTGSQCTCFSVISNKATKQKPGMGSPYIKPRFAFVDPELMLSMPPALTLMTGFDVFCHAVEAYTSKAASPLSDIHAEKALKLAGEWLQEAYHNGNNIEARSAMALADTCAGIAISNGVVTLAHVIAHVIGGHCHDIPHGDALFSIYREVLAFNKSAMPEKERFIANCIDKGNDDIMSAYDNFTKPFRFENRLKQKYQADSGLAKRIACDTFTYMKGITELNPVSADEKDVEGILIRSLSPL